MAKRITDTAGQLRASNPRHAIQLMLAAHRLTPTPEMRGQLAEMAAHTYYLRFQRPDGTIPQVEVPAGAQLTLVRGSDSAHWALFDLRGGEWHEIKGVPQGDAMVAASGLAKLVRDTVVPEEEIGPMTRRICRVAGPALTRDEWVQYFDYNTYEPPCPE